MSIAVKVEHLGKRYGYQKRHGDLRRTMVKWWHDMVQGGAKEKEFWALRDINFELKEGDTLGVIGRNGSGKSTLLKLLSRITRPSEGRIELHGRIASLLEVGTGFHPELTGRENIFLSGSFLGMSRKEITKKFDQIVHFAGVEAFIDTPVKHYSSGMYMRLAFAVAAHLEAEILLVDEVLAVGDLEFQKRCVGKMNDVSKSGRTIIFVSHDLAAVANLCEYGLLLVDGQGSIGVIQDVIQKYTGQESNSGVDQRLDTCYGSVYVKATNCSGNSIQITVGSSFEMMISFDVLTSIAEANIGIGINDYLGRRIVTSHTSFETNKKILIVNGDRITCKVPVFCLAPGRYSVEISLFDQFDRTFFNVNHLFNLTISPLDYYQTGRLPKAWHGMIMPHSEWKLNENRI